MCKTLELLGDLEAVVTQMHTHIKGLRTRQVDVDLMRTDIEHQLENHEVSSANAYNLAKAFHLLSKERRVLKDEIEIMQNILDSVNNGFGHISHYKNTKQKDYNFRKELRDKGSEAYKPRKLDLTSNVLEQVKSYLENNN